MQDRDEERRDECVDRDPDEAPGAAELREKMQERIGNRQMRELVLAEADPVRYGEDECRDDQPEQHDWNAEDAARPRGAVCPGLLCHLLVAHPDLSRQKV